MRTAVATVGVLVILGTALTTPASASPVGGSTGPPSPGDPIPLSDVEEISIGGIGRARVAIGSPAELTIDGPPDAVEQLAVDVEDGELVIEPERESGIELADGEELVYEITVKRLLDIRLRDWRRPRDRRHRRRRARGRVGRHDTASLLNVEVEELQAEVQGSAVMRGQRRYRFPRGRRAINPADSTAPTSPRERPKWRRVSWRAWWSTSPRCSRRCLRTAPSLSTSAHRRRRSSRSATPGRCEGYGNADPRPNRPWFGDGDQSGYERGCDTRHQPID